MINLRQYRPTFRLTVEGKPFNSARVLRIEATDAAGYESDELTITFDDTFPFVERPREGAAITLDLGFEETGLMFAGTYLFEEWGRNGFERTATLTAKAADHAKSLKEPKTRNWSGTVESIAGEIARSHNLKLVISEALASHVIDYIAQTNESDQNLLTRIGRRIGAVIAPKDGHLLVTERNSGKTASGQDLPAVQVTTDRLIADNAYSVNLKPRSRFSRIIANWEDAAAGRTRQAILELAVEGPSITLREVFQNEADAVKAAEARHKEVRAGEGEMTVELVGAPAARAEAPVQVLNVAPDLDGNWIAHSVTHVWDFGEEGGATTTIEAQFGMDEEKEDKPATTSANRNTGNGEYISILDR
ncbi:contractile injection system protein, VgrG/Pvc8 family [Halocynthiibacter styelae]|uniref:Phage late control D family protein n=1 Tax=Halocynthiibacter styelae TaxID=2761955 RepID=A0A8J7IEB4_9RHOB|nr:contractile injection system protein, VgrG/Pvc8 family [Paenihalocynthiibacter styelae]MBI1495418.1 hypothetical protein [Paenihalocynthiibacter styelae]